jgi:hypothetical protein
MPHEPGPELDALVAEALGWKQGKVITVPALPVGADDGFWYTGGGDIVWHHKKPPPYSTDATTADRFVLPEVVRDRWMVMAAIDLDGCSMELRSPDLRLEYVTGRSYVHSLSLALLARREHEGA